MNVQSEHQALLEPITADLPCGVSLEDTPMLAAFDAFRVFGQVTPPEPPPDWPEIKRLALEALSKSKDLRVLAYYGTALLRTDGLAAFAGTLSIAAQWLDLYWPQLFPLVVEDALERRNAVNGFADPIGVLDGLRRAPLVSSRAHGTFSLRDLELATGVLTPREGETRPDEAQIAAAFASVPREELSALYQSVRSATASSKAIDARLLEEGGLEGMTDLEPLRVQLLKIEQALAPHAAQLPAAAGQEPSAAEAGGSGAAAVGAIKSRQDALRALDAVSEFFQRTEPSSPVPLLIGRAKRLVAKDFLQVLADIAPEAVAQARAAAGLREGE